MTTYKGLCVCVYIYIYISGKESWWMSDFKGIWRKQ